MFGLAFVLACGVGFALGLTGGGGGVFAVPLLVYVLSVPPREAIGISLASVGGTAFFGTLPRLFRGEVELATGFLFAIAGMLGAPLGSYLATQVPEVVLMALFGILMLVVAWRMWAATLGKRPDTGGSTLAIDSQSPATCHRGADGSLRMTSKCARLLALVGLLTGVLAGMFGVGGGFVIVPALVLFSGMSIHRAVGTSLLAIFLISIAGVVSYLAAGRNLPADMTLTFLAGGPIGVWLGGQVAGRIKGQTLQKVFASAVALVAVFVIVKTVVL